MKYKPSQYSSRRVKGLPRNQSGARVHAHYLPQQGFHFTPTDFTEEAADRFNRFMDSVIRSPVDNPVEPQVLVAACVVAFEMLSYEDFPEFLGQLSHVKNYGNSGYVSWHTNGRLDRRAISAFTLIALSKLPSEVDWTSTLQKVVPALLQLYDFGNLPKPSQTLKSIFLDLQAWIYLEMPMPFLSHHLGCMQATPLPEAAWQRRFQLHTPPVSDQDTRARAELTEEAGVVMETYLESAPMLSGAWYVEELTSICKGLTGSNVSMKDSMVWKELLIRFKSLSKSLREAGPTEALLTGWSIFVAQLGTLRKKNPRLSRLAGYLLSAAKRLHAALRGTGRHPADLSSKEWDQIFRNVLAQDSENNTLRAALASFHSYLCITFDVEPISWLYRSLERSQRPRANCIWRHEIARLPDAIDQATDDLRLRDQLKTWSQLLTSAQVRFGELKWIRHKDIIPFEDHMQIHLANQPYVGSGKSPAADRLVFIRNPAAVQALKTWLARPEFRGAEQSQFIFSAPDSPRNIYKLGKAYALLTRCLKEVTNCSDFSIHLCRHTCISLAIEKALFQVGVFHEINPIHEVQVQSGHQSAETTWRTYFHLVEDSMRFWNTHALRRRNISYRAAEWWSGRSCVNLRQDNHRKDMFSVIDVINDAAKTHLPPPIPRQVGPTCPALAEPTSCRPTLEMLIAVLSDLFNGLHLKTTASRRGVTTVFIRRMLDGLVPALSQFRGETIPDVPMLTDAQVLVLTLSICDFVNIKFGRLPEPQWMQSKKLAQNCNDAELRELTIAWLGLAQFGNINTPPSQATANLIKGLRTLGIPVHRISIRINPNSKEDDVSIMRSTTFQKQKFHLYYGAAPQFDKNKPRRGKSGPHGRQRMYLQILTRALKPGEVAPPALNDTQTLNALMLAILVYTNFKQEN